jgi:hypothetical protein
MKAVSSVLFLSCLVFAGCSSTGETGSGEAGNSSNVTVAEAPADLQLQKLNGAFLSLYASARAQYLESRTPYLVVTFDSVTLYGKGTPAPLHYTPPLYHDYKMVAHAVLSMFCLTEQLAGRLTDADREKVENFLEQVVAARESLAGVGFPAEDLPRQGKILGGVEEYLKSLLESGLLDKPARDKVLRQLRPLVMEDVAAAARLQLDDLNRVVKRLCSDLHLKERQDLHVVVTGTHQARDRYLQMVYFRKAMGEESAVEERLVFCELLFAREDPADPVGSKALQLLGTHLLDEEASRSIFGDRARLESDILANEAERYVREMDLPILK